MTNLSHNPLSFRVCGECSAKHTNSIVGVFTNTFYKCKICKNPFLDGCYMLFTSESNEHLVHKPVGFFGGRRSGKTNWLVGKIDEYEIDINPIKFVVIVPSQSEVLGISELINKLAGLDNERFICLTDIKPERIEEAIVSSKGECNFYVDNIEKLNELVINELAIGVASYRIKQLFYTKNITALDLLIENSHTYKSIHKSALR